MLIHKSRRRFISLFKFTLLRYSLVSLAGECLYFILYGIFWAFTKNTSQTLAMSGGICVIFNAYVHSKLTFNVTFSRKLLFGYTLIQLFGYLVAMVLGIAMDSVRAENWLIALVTYIVWAIISYTFTKRLYRG